MANNGVSQHFKIDGGADLTSDSQFATLGANTKIVYKPNSEKYIKNPNYSNVFDKAKSFVTDGELSSVSAELGTVKSRSITAIDDANASGVCSCKNASGTQVDTFTCHVSKSASNPTLSWGSTTTIGTIDGTAFKVTMPANPNTDTKYYAGTALTLNGTTFNHNNYLDTQSGYYHTCIAPSGLKLNGNTLSLTGLSIRFNEQGHVTGYKNADPVTVDLSSISGSTTFSGSWTKLADNFKGTSVSHTFSKGGFILWNPTYENSGYVTIDGVDVAIRTSHDYAYGTSTTVAVPAGSTAVVTSDNNGSAPGTDRGLSGTVWILDFAGNTGGSSSGGSSSGGSSGSGGSTPSEPEDDAIQERNGNWSFTITNSSVGNLNAQLLTYVKNYIDSRAVSIISSDLEKVNDTLYRFHQVKYYIR